MKNKLGIITKCTLTIGIIGMATTCIGLGANLAGVVRIPVSHFYQKIELKPCIKKGFLFREC
jgi:hypothetical protein